MNNRSIIAIVVAIVLSLCCCLAMLFLGAGVLIAPRINGVLVTSTPTPAPAVLRALTPTPLPVAASTSTPAASPAVIHKLTPTTLPITTSTPTPTPSPVATSTPAERFASTEEALAKTTVPERDLIALTARLKKVDQPIPLVVNDTPPNYAVGDKDIFWVGNIDTTVNYSITATLSYLTPHLYLWVEEGVSFDQEALKRSAERFENHIYPTNRRLFGSEWTPGVDNDPHIHILQAGGLGATVLGYYLDTDEYSKLVNPYSNEREMFYINSDRLQPGTETYESVLAHEFQHMIHWAVDADEDAWVNEAFSELASHLNGYDVGGFDRVFSSNPDTQLTSWPDGPGQASANYGASFLFAAYFLERFGDQSVRRVVSHQANGAAGFEAILTEHGLTFDDFFADWLMANYLDDAGIADGRYGYRDLTVGPANLDQTHRDYPAQRSATVHQYGADYIELQGEGDLVLSFTGSTEVKLVPTHPHSGKYFWWSNRGDNSNMTLTRAFDLTGLSRATLKAWLWYDIEENWDYAYIEVSTDGGQTWDILEGQYTTDSNPNGNSFGQAYTGKSQASADEAPDWVEEEMDLTPYVGQEILLRFEYITDGAVNHVGLCVDDIAIPELGYSDDADTSTELSTGGDEQWIAEGWIRTDNTLPQRFLVQLIELGPNVRVQRVELDDTQSGRLVVEGLGNEVERAVLVVSALAPVTTELASYEYSIELAQGD
ncbi:MAG: immune inhibitor A [Anaerolineales bacterium]|nr:immune inhibitor A [Anaerolineales bacterium]